MGNSQERAFPQKSKCPSTYKALFEGAHTVRFCTEREWDSSQPLMDHLLYDIAQESKAMEGKGFSQERSLMGISALRPRCSMMIDLLWKKRETKHGALKMGLLASSSVSRSGGSFGESHPATYHLLNNHVTIPGLHACLIPDMHCCSGVLWIQTMSIRSTIRKGKKGVLKNLALQAGAAHIWFPFL